MINTNGHITWVDQSDAPGLFPGVEEAMKDGGATFIDFTQIPDKVISTVKKFDAKMAMAAGLLVVGLVLLARRK